MEELTQSQAGPTEADRDAMLQAAVAAPSMHNTQPWRFRFTGWTAEVYRDRRRELPAEDLSRRMLFISLGAAILNLRVAAAARGIGSAVRHLVDQRRPDLVAEIDLGGSATRPLAELAPYLTERRTNRQPFTDQGLSDDVRALLDLSAWAESAKLQWLDRPSHQWRLQMATKEAITADDRSPTRTAERRQWVGGGRTVDGIPSSALGPRSTSGETVVRDLAATAADALRPTAEFEREPQLAVLLTRFDGPIEWLRAGQALEHVLLEATAHGVSVSMLNLVIEHEQLRSQINDPFDSWQRPQVVLRFGYGPPVPPTPRRPIADVLIRD
jgi:nitroreductase